MRLNSFAFLIVAAPLAAALPDSGSPPPREEPRLAVRVDGSWAVTQLIAEDRPPLDARLRGLVRDERPSAADRRRDREAERMADEAFEDAIEPTRREPRR